MTIRRREAASSDLLSAFAIAVASSSVNFSRRPSIPDGRSSSVDATFIAPHRRPSTTIGLATDETIPMRRAAPATEPLADDQSIVSTRAERPVRYTSSEAIPGWNSHRVPTGRSRVFETPTKTTAGPSCSNLSTAACALNRRATSSLTAEKISTGGTPCAASVATRRSAACSSTSRVRAACDSAFAIAVATSSVKEARRASVSAGSGCSSWPLNATTMQPHSRLSALTGTPTEERSPQS